MTTTLDDRTVRVPIAIHWAAMLPAVASAIVIAHGTSALAAFVVFDLVIAAIAIIDLEQLRIPNKILGPAFLASVPLLALAAMADGDWDRLAWAGASAVVLFAMFVVLHAFRPRSLGMGDVKLAPYLALHLGWIGPGAVVTAFMLGALAAAVAGALAMQFWKGTWKSALPYAPFLALGALLGQLLYHGAL